jgi:hypothetical protein
MTKLLEDRLHVGLLEANRPSDSWRFAERWTE